MIGSPTLWIGIERIELRLLPLYYPLDFDWLFVPVYFYDKFSPCFVELN